MTTNVNMASFYFGQEALEKADDSYDESYVVFIPLGLGLLFFSVWLRCHMRRRCERRKSCVVEDPEASLEDLSLRRFSDPPPDYDDVTSDPPPPLYSEVFPPDAGMTS
ncbi:uncharacterized protein LOC122263125 [Penaeus japonicus]|uniref:uncharacterized protein LOC122263125 n=1 Tax=Penaeus japonicus TaxID=27405 RepID=UPI001C715A3A|nr:uncharacterized protein LOC122263125 [Penaeus japonicus]